SPDKTVSTHTANTLNRFCMRKGGLEGRKRRARVKNGSMSRQKARERLVSRVLACGLESGHRFCEVKTGAGKDETVKLKINLE
ncbi:MAG: hypothetical protein ACOC6C_04510, partial [Verrucomicrobiota bacterium]